ncbi:hypothetical protein AOLI_G00213250 [Acnodon oligacanthus]
MWLESRTALVNSGIRIQIRAWFSFAPGLMRLGRHFAIRGESRHGRTMKHTRAGLSQVPTTSDGNAVRRREDVGPCSPSEKRRLRLTIVSLHDVYVLVRD